MHRIFQNTTAIAACLSLLAPHMAAAQTATDGDAQVVLPPAETAPQTDATPEAATTDPAPVEDGTAAETSLDEAVDAGSEATTTPAEAGTTATDAEATSDTDAEATAEADTADDEALLDEAMAAEQDSTDDAMTETTGASSEADSSAEATTSTDAEATSTEAEAETTTTSTVGTEAPAPTEAEAQAETSIPGADTATTTAAEVDAPETAPATASEGEATAGSGAPVTDVSREAATQSTEAPTAAALDDSASAEVTEEEVTEENSRSSNEDFATSLQQATSTDGNQAPSSDDNGSNLAKAVLLGLGGVAVGAMLSNNRQVALSTPDRIVVTRPDGSQQLIKDDVALLRQPGSTVATENFDDGSSRTIVTRADGSHVVTIRDADLRILRRTLVSADGTQTILLDETTAVEPVDVASLPAPAQGFDGSAADLDEVQLREALMRASAVDRRFSLSQIRDIPEVRSLVASVDVNAVTFETNSAAIDADQAKTLTALGNVIREAIDSNPNEIFLIEGHTDTVGDPAANLALSDRRAESVALALSEYFQVPAENMVVQGYGEQFPKIQQEGDVRENRRASVRRITDLLQTASN